MRDCHRRIGRFFEQLRAVVARSPGGVLTDTDRRSMKTALDYLAQAAIRHTEDEELSLFPRLRCLGMLDSVLDNLEVEHRRTACRHGMLDRLGRQWLTVGWLNAVEYERFRAEISGLITSYTRHIHCEEEHVLPSAAELLCAEEQRNIGREMALRRADDPGEAHSRCARRRRKTLTPTPPMSPVCLTLDSNSNSFSSACNPYGPKHQYELLS